MDNSLIKRQDAIDAINAYLGLSAVSRTIQNMTSIQEILENLPSASPDLSAYSDKLWKNAYERGKEEGRKKGKWIANGDIHKECPFCGEDWDKYVFGEVWYTDELPKFCPNCGADMRGEQNDTD